MRTILTVLYVANFLFWGSPVLGVVWIISRFKKDKTKTDLFQLRMVQWAFRCVMFFSGVKLKVYHHELVPTGEPVMYIGNHRSIFDIVTTYSLCPELTGYISKDNVGKVPLLGLYMKRLHCLFLVRDDMKQSMKVIIDAINLVKAGISVCVFPEGTRNKNQEDKTEVLDFKEGSFKIATKTGCKIVPMAITGSADIMENHFPWIKSGTVTVTYGEPIDPKSLSKEEQKFIGSYCQKIVSDMVKNAYAKLEEDK